MMLQIGLLLGSVTAGFIQYKSDKAEKTSSSEKSKPEGVQFEIITKTIPWDAIAHGWLG